MRAFTVVRLTGRTTARPVQSYFALLLYLPFAIHRRRRSHSRRRRCRFSFSFSLVWQYVKIPVYNVAVTSPLVFQWRDVSSGEIISITRPELVKVRRVLDAKRSMDLCASGRRHYLGPDKRRATNSTEGLSQPRSLQPRANHSRYHPHIQERDKREEAAKICPAVLGAEVPRNPFK